MSNRRLALTEQWRLPILGAVVPLQALGIMAVVAQAERKMISARTKAALEAAKARGVRLGGDRGNLPAVAEKGRQAGLEARRKAADQRAVDLAPIIADLRAHGSTSLRQIAIGLNALEIPAARGGKWTAAQVARVVKAAMRVAPP
jgi:DNA invertase Pin-like site-specific DNA recombinase